MNNELLPLGTVCTLKDGEKKLMITAFLVTYEGEEFEYCGCLYPEGIIDPLEHYLFNNVDIQEIHYMGFVNEEEKEFKKSLTDIVNSLDETTKVESLDIISDPKIEEFLEIPILSQQTNNSDIEIETL